MKERDAEARTVEECLILDTDKVGAVHDLYDKRGGGYIDDGDILIEKWSPGMGIVALNYCEDGDDYVSMQLVVGDGKNEEIPLRKHGGAGGKCRRWRL